MILPGFPRAAGGRGPLFVGAAAHIVRRSTIPADLSFNLAIPAAARPGDLLIAHVTASGAHEKPVGSPAGWTTIENEDVTGSSVPSWRVMYRYMQAGDTVLPASALTTLTLSAGLQVWRAAALGAHRVAPRIAFNFAPGITSVAAGSSLALFAEMNVAVAETFGPTITGPASATEKTSRSAPGAGGCAHWSGIEQHLPAGNTGSRAFADDVAADTEYWSIALIEIKRAD